MDFVNLDEGKHPVLYIVFIMASYSNKAYSSMAENFCMVYSLLSEIPLYKSVNQTAYILSLCFSTPDLNSTNFKR